MPRAWGPGTWGAGSDGGRYSGVLCAPAPQALTAPPPPLQSTAKKMEIIKGLFVACRHSEARFIAR